MAGIDAGTKLMLHLNEDLLDSSLSGHIASSGGGLIYSTATKKFGTASGQFNTTPDTYLSVPNHTDWDFGTGDFTIDCQWQPSGAFNTDLSIIGGGLANDWLYWDHHGNSYFRFELMSGTVHQFAYVRTDNTFYHIAAVRSSNNLQMYVNGSAIHATGVTDTTSVAANYPIRIGHNLVTNVYNSGWIDELRISNSARWTTGFTAPSAEYSGVGTSASGGSGGDGNTYNITAGFGGMGMFDFGATSLRWLTVGAGTGVYASSNLGLTFVAVATDRTQTFQNFERSKNGLVCTTDNYDTPLWWTGSVGTYATVLNVSAPLCRYAINYNAFLILLNSNTDPRAFYYEDEKTQLTGDWGDSFSLPSSFDDEITGAVILNKKLYVSTRYRLFRVTYVGGHPDWTWLMVKDWGFVPRTIKKITLANIGEVVVGMSWDKRIRLFDGSDDRIISDNIENYNSICDFAMEKIYTEGSGLRVCVSEMDRNEQAYKLCLAVGNSSYATHMINFDGRTMSFYPYDNQKWQSLAMVESADKLYLMAADSNGYVYMLNTGNTDVGTAIDDVYSSPFYYSKSPSAVSKQHKIDFYFTPDSSNWVYFADRTDFSSVWTDRERFKIAETESLNTIKKSVDVRQTYNTYQYRIMSSSNTADPWRLNRTDTFLEEKGIGGNE